MAAAPNGAMRNLAAIAMGSAAAGFGWSAGRDLYKKGKEWVLPAIAIAAVAGGSGFAAWNLTRGHREPSASRFAVSVIAAAGSFLLSAAILMGMAGNGGNGKPPGDPMVGLLMAVGLQAGSAFLGFLVGSAQGVRRRRAFAIERHNLDFMATKGIRDVGGREDTYIDGADNELKLDDVRRDAMVFKIPGRRVVRAYIDLDADGRMTGYRPPP